MLINGDCLKEVEKLVNDGIQVDSIVTDPPYHLTSIVERFGKEGSAPVKDKDGAFQRQSVGFMGKEWDGGDIAFRKETWELFMKVLKPGGHLLAFSGSRTYHRMATAIEDAGFDIRDQIMWLYGSGFPKSLNIGKEIDKKLGNKREVIGTKECGYQVSISKTRKEQGYRPNLTNATKEVIVDKGDTEFEGWGTALKPAHEPIVLARKPLSEKSIVENVLKHRTGGIHIDACRIKIENQNTERKTTKRKSRSEGGLWTDDNSGMDNTQNTFADADPRGRYPSNVMHDGSEEVLKRFPYTKSGKMKQHIEGGQYNVYGKMYPRDVETIGDEGSAARFFYCAKTSKAERHKGLENLPVKEKVFNGTSSTSSKDMKGVEKKFTTKPSANIHPTVKPVKLMKYLCRLITPKGGTVLDPFMGSGSTGIAAKDEGFDFIGIEKEKEYFDIAKQRISVPYKDQMDLF